eukprot:5565693-Pyramimonas_sp.AAC.2
MEFAVHPCAPLANGWLRSSGKPAAVITRPSRGATANEILFCNSGTKTGTPRSLRVGGFHWGVPKSQGRVPRAQARNVSTSAGKGPLETSSARRLWGDVARPSEEERSR